MSVGKWLRLVWLTMWAGSLVAVIVGVVHVIVSSRHVTREAVALVLGASLMLFFVVESMGIAARRPPR